MALLNNLFDVKRGWPREGAIDETFPVHVTTGTPDVLPPGTVVTVQAADGTVAVATTPNRTNTDAVKTWVVVESNQDFSGQYLQKVVCLRANAVFRLDPANLDTGVYTVGLPLSFTGGLWKVAATTNQVIGEVLANNVATDGTIDVYYSGGDTAKI